MRRGSPATLVLMTSTGVTREELRAAQRPLREKYQSDPTTAWTLTHADAEFADPGITCTVQTWAGPVIAGLQPATGGTGEHSCSTDMILQALLGCTGVTLRSVATAMSLDLGEVHLRAESHYDARGTLGVDRSVDVGLGPITVTITVTADLDDATLQRLATSTERYCVVAHSLRQTPDIRVVRAAG